MSIGGKAVGRSLKRKSQPQSTKHNKRLVISTSTSDALLGVAPVLPPLRSTSSLTSVSFEGEMLSPLVRSVHGKKTYAADSNTSTLSHEIGCCGELQRTISQHYREEGVSTSLGTPRKVVLAKDYPREDGTVACCSSASKEVAAVVDDHTAAEPRTQVNSGFMQQLRALRDIKHKHDADSPRRLSRLLSLPPEEC